MSTKNSNRFRAGLRALTNPANLPDFAPGEYDEEWEQARRFQRDFLSDDVRLGGTIWGDEPLTPLQPLPERESFNWKAFRFYALAFTGLVLSQVVVALAVNASR